MYPISESVIRKLEALAKTGEAISTKQMREVLGMSAQQINRLTLFEFFPQRPQVGRTFWIAPAQLLQFVRDYNALANAITITEAAILLRSTVPTARRLARGTTFPKPLGEVNGRPRWDKTALIEWHRARFGGASLPPDADVETGAHEKVVRRYAKGTRNGKAKKGKAPRG